MRPAQHSTHEAPGGVGLPEALSLLGTSLASCDIGAVVADRAGTILWGNKIFFDLAGAASAGPRSRRLEELLVGIEKEPGEEATSQASRPAAPRLVSFPARPGRYFRSVQAPLGAASGEVLHLLLDCTQEVASDRERRRREQYLARAVEASMDAILSLDTEGLIRYWNHGAERMFGYQAEEVIGRPYDLLVPEDLKEEGELDRITEILDRQGVLRNFETVRLARDGHPVEVDITVTRLKDDAGAILGRSVIYRNISLRHQLERKAAEFQEELSRKVVELRAVNLKLRRNQQRLIDMEKLSAIGEMAAKVAHEIRTPLVTIGGFSHNLWKNLPEGAPDREPLEIIREEVQRLERFVSEILEYARPGAIETEPCDVNAIVEDAVRPHLDQLGAAGIELEKQLDPSVAPVRVNRYQIHQVLTNLIVNAMQAMGAQTAAGAEKSARLTLTTEPGENHVRVCVSDNGPGIPERHRSRVSRPFFTTKPGGSGLGLAISAQIVAQHQATLTFESEEGKGTTFQLCLPVRREVFGEDDPGGG